MSLIYHNDTFLILGSIVKLIVLYQKHQLEITASFLRNGGLDSLLAIGVGADPDSVSLTLVAGSWASCCNFSSLAQTTPKKEFIVLRRVKVKIAFQSARPKISKRRVSLFGLHHFSDNPPFSKRVHFVGISI